MGELISFNGPTSVGERDELLSLQRVLLLCITKQLQQEPAHSNQEPPHPVPRIGHISGTTEFLAAFLEDGPERRAGRKLTILFCSNLEVLKFFFISHWNKPKTV